MNVRALGILLILAGLGIGSNAVSAAEEGGRMLSHDVYFTLKDKSPQAKEKLIAACKKYLSTHPGTVWFAAGPLGEDFQRDVNDRDFDVALHLVFKNKAAHDTYATAETHLKFIAENEESWEKVRVFDSYVDASSHGDVPLDRERAGERKPARPEERKREREQPEAARKPSLPDPAAGFAGMIRGLVVQKFDGGFTFKVARVVEEWKANKAKDSKSLVGKTIQIAVDGTQENAARFFKILEAGAEVTLDVAHKSGESLTIVELTAEQRERVKNVRLER